MSTPLSDPKIKLSLHVSTHLLLTRSCKGYVGLGQDKPHVPLFGPER